MMDDEKYFGLTGYQMSGNIHFYSSDPTQTPTEVKNRAKVSLNQRCFYGLQFQRMGFRALLYSLVNRDEYTH